MNRNSFAITAVIGCAALVILLVVAIPAAFLIPSGRLQVFGRNPAGPAGGEALNVPDTGAETLPPNPIFTPGAGLPPLVDLYQENYAGVVSILSPTQAADQGEQVNGSGFLLDDEGHILTAYHLIPDAGELTVVFYNGFEARARVVGRDAGSGLAVLHVAEHVEGAHALTLGDADAMQVGEWVAALGNPSGHNSSMTAGIVSALGRPFPYPYSGLRLPLAIQTQAAVHAGNTGGPLLNLEGEVIGVNLLQAQDDGQAAPGVGYAISAEVVRRVVPVMIENGTYQWPWLGLSARPVDRDIAEANRLPDQQGVYLTRVLPGGPAEKAGLSGSLSPLGGDIILAANGKQVENLDRLLAQILFLNPGDQVLLEILRAGTRLEVPLMLEARPEGTGEGIY